MADISLELEIARHDERIAFAEMEAMKLAYDVSKKKYNRAKFILDTLLDSGKKEKVASGRVAIKSEGQDLFPAQPAIQSTMPAPPKMVLDKTGSNGYFSGSTSNPSPKSL